MSRTHDVEFFERDDRPGGHTNTITHDGLALDTGFIVHNRANYPALIRLFDELGVATQPSQMSFSVSCARHHLEYTGRRPLGHAPLRLIREITRFLREARGTIVGAREQTVGAYVAEHGYSPQFRDHFLVPLTASLWSSGTGAALDFPAGLHALGSSTRTGCSASGGSRGGPSSAAAAAYVQALLERSGATVHLSSAGALGGARRTTVSSCAPPTTTVRRFDGVVLAVHGDQALPLLADPTDDERRVLSAFRSTDERDRPTHRRAAAARPRRSRVVELPPRRLRLAERAPDDHLLPQPAPGRSTPTSTTA